MDNDIPVNLKFYQIIDLPNGLVTPGRNDLRSHPKRFRFENIFSNKIVLDVATNDGFWAFKAKDLGASHVKAIDVDYFENYDWSYDGVPSNYVGATNNRLGFDWINNKFDYGVVRESKSIYDLCPSIDGVYDISICYGLFYHLRHPLLGLDKLRRVTSGASIIQTNVSYFGDPLPLDLFILDDVWNGITNWTMTSISGFIHYMKSSGYKYIYVDKIGRPSSQLWQSRIFVGCISEEMNDHFKNNCAFQVVDDEYFSLARDAIKRSILSVRQI